MQATPRASIVEADRPVPLSRRRMDDRRGAHARAAPARSILARSARSTRAQLVIDLSERRGARHGRRLAARRLSSAASSMPAAGSPGAAPIPAALALIERVRTVVAGDEALMRRKRREHPRGYRRDRALGRAMTASACCGCSAARSGSSPGASSARRASAAWRSAADRLDRRPRRADHRPDVVPDRLHRRPAGRVSAAHFRRRASSSSISSAS